VDGWPRTIEGRRCRQSVGIKTISTVSGHDYHACSLAGHLGDVLAQVEADEMIERIRSETRPEPRAFDRTEATPHYRAAMLDAGRGSLIRG
jgi:hypothetical protein